MLTVDVSAASRPLPGETHCGDQFVIVSVGCRHMVALADGLGHGVLAEQAARTAVDCVAADPWADLATLLRECDRALSGGRGAVMTLLRIDTHIQQITYAGVGNVEIMALTLSPVRPINAPGIVGGRFRTVRESVHAIAAGDLLALHSDGVSSRMDLAPYRQLDAASTAAALLREGAKAHDDAACVVIRFHESQSQ